MSKKQILTNSNHFLNLDTGRVDLLGKLTDGLVWVLVGKRVNIYSHAWKTKKGCKKGELIHSSLYAPSVFYFHHTAGYTAFLGGTPPPPFLTLHSDSIAFHVIPMKMELINLKIFVGTQITWLMTW